MNIRDLTTGDLSDNDIDDLITFGLGYSLEETLAGRKTITTQEFIESVQRGRDHILAMAEKEESTKILECPIPQLKDSLRRTFESTRTEAQAQEVNTVIRPIHVYALHTSKQD